MSKLINRNYHWPKASQRGDTIVEVLISIIVLSSVLVGAYGIASRATKENIQAQEHSQAMQIAQGQIETLKTQTTSPATAFCFDTNNSNALVVWQGAMALPPANYQSDSFNGNYPLGCAQNLTGGACSGDLCYHVAIQKSGPASSDYNVTVRWPGANSGNDQVSLAYRWNQ